VALEDAADELEDEAVRRGRDGYLEPIIYQGKVMGDWVGPDGRPCDPQTEGATFIPLCVRRYSDQLLVNLLRWRRYGDRVRHEPSGVVDPSATAHQDYTISPQTLREYHDLMVAAGLDHLEEGGGSAGSD
jgi:hypothetical protein